MSIILLVLVFGIGIIALKWFMTFAGILLAIAGIGLLVWWGTWVKNNRA